MFTETAGTVVWLTGLSGSGKTTLCHLVAADLLALGHRVQVLDGDVMRKDLCRDLTFSDADRIENIRRISYIAGLLSTHGVIVLVAAISPLRMMRQAARDVASSFLEVFIDAPLRICEQRDPKGLYKLARAGQIQSFTGIDSPYESPDQPDVVCRTNEETVSESKAKILQALLSNSVTTKGLRSDSPNDAPLVEQVRQPTLAVDVDGVIANYDGWRGVTVLGEPRQDVRKALIQLRNEGWKIIVHTTRSAEILMDYLRAHHIPFDEINSNSSYLTGSPKPVATVYWDDRGLKYSGNAEQDLPLIRSFRTWNGRS